MASKSGFSNHAKIFPEFLRLVRGKNNVFAKKERIY
jgi:hypothetical protein